MKKVNLSPISHVKHCGLICTKCAVQIKEMHTQSLIESITSSVGIYKRSVWNPSVPCRNLLDPHPTPLKKQ